MNGVSHQVVSDDLDGAAAVLNWLSTMPPVIGVPPCCLPTCDPLDRAIGYLPGPGDKVQLQSSHTCSLIYG